MGELNQCFRLKQDAKGGNSNKRSSLEMAVFNKEGGKFLGQEE